VEIIGLIGVKKSKAILYVVSVLPSKKGDIFKAVYKTDNATQWAIDYNGEKYVMLESAAQNPYLVRNYKYDPKKHEYLV